MRALVVGASGLVGGALMRVLGDSDVGTFRSRRRPGLRYLDAADAASVRSALEDVAPEVIFFPAANPNVDWCEQEPAEAARENLDPLRTLLSFAPGRSIIAYSSDYVFDGARGPYAEGADVSPVSVYGRIKAELERLVLGAGGPVIRTTGVFGQEPPPARNFALRLAATLGRGERVRVPNDQIANPTFVEDLATASVAIARSMDRGIWHIAGPDLVSRYDFARRVASVFDVDPELIDGVPSSELAQPARRPLRGGLLCSRYRDRFGKPPVRPLRDALTDLRDGPPIT